MEEGEETSVAFLLAAGASEEDIWSRQCTPSLWMAVENGREHIVRMLVAAGIAAVGGSTAILGAMFRASSRRQARILDILLGVEGQSKKKHWAQQLAGNVPILHHAIMYGSLTTVHVCLVAGADENFVTATGVRANRVIRMAPPTATNPVELRAAIDRMLQRGPAFRARSWAWPPKVDAAVVGAALAVTLETSGKLKTSVRVFRPRDDRLFTTRFAR